MVKQKIELFRDAATLDISISQTNKVDTNKGLDALFKRMDVQRMEFEKSGYSIKNGQKVEYFFGNNKKEKILNITEEQFTESLRNVSNHAMTKVMAKNIASFSSSLAANNTINIENLECVNLNLDISQKSFVDLVTDRSVTQKTYTEINKEVSSEAQNLMNNEEVKKGVDLNGVVDTVASEAASILGVGNSSSTDKKDIHKSISTKIGDKIQNKSEQVMTSDNITEMLDSAAAENSVNLQNVKCINSNIKVKQENMVNALLKSSVFAEQVNNIAVLVREELKQEMKDIDMNVGTDAVIGETLVSGIDAAGDAAIKVGQGIKEAGSGFFGAMSTGIIVWGAVAVAIVIAMAFMFYSLMGNEALTGAMANKVRNS